MVLIKVGLALGLLLLLSGDSASAETPQWPAWMYPKKNKAPWENVDPKRRSWFESQQINPAAQKRLGVDYKSCCDGGDVYKTRFQIVEDGSPHGVATYAYWKKDHWEPIPPDIIRRDKTPDGQPVLFINKHTGKELCFIIDEPGI